MQCAKIICINLFTYVKGRYICQNMYYSNGWIMIPFGCLKQNISLTNINLLFVIINVSLFVRIIKCTQASSCENIFSVSRIIASYRTLHDFIQNFHLADNNLQFQNLKFCKYIFPSRQYFFIAKEKSSGNIQINSEIPTLDINL